MRGQPVGQRLVVGGHGGLGHVVAQRGGVTGQEQGQDRRQPGPQQVGGQQAAGERGPERQRGGDLPGVPVGVGQAAEHEGAHVGQDAQGQHLGDQVVAAEEAAQRAQQAPGGQGQAEQVHRGQGRPRAERDVHHVGAVQVEQALPGDPEVLGQRRGVGHAGVQRQQDEPAQVPDDPQDEQGDGQRGQAGRDQGQLEPHRGQAAAGPHHALVDPHAAGDTDRQQGGADDQAVGDGGPGQHQPDQRRHEPAPRRAVQDQEDRQHRHGGPDVVGHQHQHVDRVTELGGEHDAGADQDPGHALAAGGPALGQQAGQQDQQGVGERGRGVHHVRPQPADDLHDHVLGQLGGVEGHVGQGPAAQQRVAVQHVPRFQGVGRGVGGDGLGGGHPQVADEQHDARHRVGGDPREPGP